MGTQRNFMPLYALGFTLKAYLNGENQTEYSDQKGSNTGPFRLVHTYNTYKGEYLPL